MIKNYIQLIKPGYIVANFFTALAGYLLASKMISIHHFFATMAAITFGMASACVMNNYIDKNIDSIMNRTKKRVLVTGKISKRDALIFAILLALISSVLFIVYTNLITFVCFLVGMFFYLVLYSVSKRRTSWSTVIGSVPCAIVPVAGYTAVTGRLDLSAVLLFLTLVFWQMPHFYSIGIYRRRDYENAHLPVLPVSSGVTITKIHILFYALAFAIVVISLPMVNHLSAVYLVIMPLLSVIWVVYAVIGFFLKQSDKWARKMFFFSLIINVMWCITIIINYFVISK